MFEVFIKALFLNLILDSAVATKWLLDNPGFNSPDAWLNGRLPCSLDEVIFPADYSAVLPLPKKIDVRGFVLPRDGALLLNNDGEINLGSDKSANSCDNSNGERTAELKRPTAKKWFSPLSWRLTPVLQQNKAMPAMEKPPCHNESVIIQDKGALSLDLENVMYLRMGELNLAGSVISRAYLLNLFNTDLGGILFKNSQAVEVQYYREKLCGCFKSVPEYIDVVCHNMDGMCPVPHCRTPVAPYGSCCAVCGAVLRFFIGDECDNEKYHKLRRKIDEAIKKAGLANEVDFHVSYMNQADGVNYLQAVLVDRDAYHEKSVQLVQTLNASTNWQSLLDGPHTLVVQYAGRPYNPSITFGSILLILLGLLLICVVGLVIFAHYSPDNRMVNRIPVWLYEPRRWRDFIMRTPFVFDRFDGAAQGGNARGALGGARDIEESIIIGYDAECDEVRQERRRAFDNPMFGQKREVGAVGGGDKERQQKPEMTLESGSLEEIGSGGEEQELTEIKLESSSEEEDDDVNGVKVKETKE